MTEQITVPRATWDAMREALNKLLKRDQRNTCQHEETHRGGVIWEICEGCGMKWADDRGGKPKWRNPPEWDAAELALTAANAAQPQAQGDVSTGYVKVRVDTNPSKEGFCFCSPEDPETGDFQDEAQFFGRVYAHPQAPTDLAQAAISLQDAWLHHTGAEPSESVLGQAIDRAAELLLQVGRPQAQGGRGICGEIRGACGLPCEPCEGKPDPEWVTKNPQATEPAGWKLVPVDPTREMLVALVCTGLRNTFYEEGRSRFMEEMAQGYRALLAAAPEAP